MQSPQADIPRVAYASFWRRWWALVIDFWLLVIFASAFVGFASGNNSGLIVAAFVALYVVGLTAEGGTPGKRMLSLRVVRLDGSRPGLGRALLREVVGRPLSTIPLWLGYLWMLDQPQRQTWHDRMADTIVVRELPVAQGPYWSAAPPWIAQEPAPTLASGNPARVDGVAGAAD